jgi:ATP-dependent Clp protease ATP-binding subunit ClpC
VIVFHKLTKEEITTIVELLLRRVRESLADRELQLDLTDSARDLLVEQGWDPAMGARPLRRAIQRFIEDPLADFVLKSEAPAGSTILVDRAPEKDSKEVTLKIVKPKKKRKAVAVGAEDESPGDESGDDSGSAKSDD